jgi:hypothetical protein
VQGGKSRKFITSKLISYGVKENAALDLVNSLTHESRKRNRRWALLMILASIVVAMASVGLLALTEMRLFAGIALACIVVFFSSIGTLLAGRD